MPITFSGCRTGELRPKNLLPATWTSVQKTNAQRQVSWNQWGKQNLQHGDLLFVMGESRILMGLLNVSKFSADIASSDYSHVGIVAIEEGEPVVYDIVTAGARRIPFDQYATHSDAWSLAVKRLRPEYSSSLAPAVEFCSQVYQRGDNFDSKFRLDNENYYCVELIEAAFRQNGVALSEPVAINRLPNFEKLSTMTVQVVKAATSLSEDQQILWPGNDDFGLWSSPILDLVLPNTNKASPPALNDGPERRHPTVERVYGYSPTSRQYALQ